MATHSSIPAWRIPLAEESGGLHSMGLQRVGQDWVTNTFISLSEKNCFTILCWFLLYSNMNQPQVCIYLLPLALPPTHPHPTPLGCHGWIIFHGMCVPHLIHSSIDGHLGCFHVLVTVNSSAVNTGVHASFWIIVLFGNMPRSWTAG